MRSGRSHRRPCPAQVGAGESRTPAAVTWNWDGLDDADFAALGSVVVPGSAVSNDPAAPALPATLTVILTAAAERNVAPESTPSATFTESPSYAVSRTINGVPDDKGWSNWRSGTKNVQDTLTYALAQPRAADQRAHPLLQGRLERDVGAEPARRAPDRHRCVDLRGHDRHRRPPDGTGARDRGAARRRARRPGAGGDGCASADAPDRLGGRDHRAPPRPVRCRGRRRHHGRRRAAGGSRGRRHGLHGRARRRRLAAPRVRWPSTPRPTCA